MLLKLLRFIQEFVQNVIIYNAESVIWRYSVKKGVFKNFANLTGKHLC